MKKLFSLAILLLTASVAWSQTPEKISYQAVIRDVDGNLVVNQTVGLRVSIVQSWSAFGSEIFAETHTPQTNENGLVSVRIGDGSTLFGSLESIDWSTGQYQIRSQADPDGGTNYTITSLSQLLTVPYAFHAKTAESIPSLQYEVGDYAHGGVVFYVDESGQHGLVCDIQNRQSIWSPTLCMVSNPDPSGSSPLTFGAVYTGATGDGLYAGQQNTNVISALSISMEGMTCGNCAARVCAQLETGSGPVAYGDWYLPGLSELQMIYDQKDVIEAVSLDNGGDTFLTVLYWSSTEANSSEAHAVHFNTGVFSPEHKEFGANNFRAIRRF